MATPTPPHWPALDYPPEVHALLLHARQVLWREREQRDEHRQAQLTLLRNTGGTPPYQPHTIALRHDSDPLEQVRRLVPALLAPPTGRHVGTLLLADCIMLRGDVDNEWAALAAGAPRQDAQVWRVAFGVLVSGWRVGTQWRDDNPATVIVAAPWQRRPMCGELNDVLRSFNERVAAEQ